MKPSQNALWASLFQAMLGTEQTVDGVTLFVGGDLPDKLEKPRNIKLVAGPAKPFRHITRITVAKS